MTQAWPETITPNLDEKSDRDRETSRTTNPIISKSASMQSNQEMQNSRESTKRDIELIKRALVRSRSWNAANEEMGLHTPKLHGDGCDGKGNQEMGNGEGEGGWCERRARWNEDPHKKSKFVRV